MSLDYGKLNLVEALPLSRFAPEGSEKIFRRLRGATIVRIGGTDDEAIEGGGLIIDYRTAGGRSARLVLGFNENGMWIEYDSLGPIGMDIQDDPAQDARKIA